MSELDFINRGMLFAGILLLCFFPSLIILNSLSGRSAVTTLSRRLGLNKEAAADLGHLFTSTSATSAAVTGTSYVFAILGGIAVAGSVQELYEGVFQLERRGMRNVVRDLLWLGALIASALLGSWLGPILNSSGGPVLFGVVGFVSLVGFWWLSLWFLLSQRVPWRELLPSAIATALFWVGMQVVFSFVFSSTVISNNDKYGPIGVVFALMSWLIAVGVVIILGAVAGIVWRNRKRPGISDHGVQPDKPDKTDDP